ncbi:MAG: SoxR reducing system RseC family protein [Muribaculaceae bacterium]|nr:SoxR reducing system RseC family protein [Muribaculaceae bacterium]
MNRSVVRNGTVTYVGKHSVAIAVDDGDGCGSCGIRSVCNRDSDHGIVTVPIASPADYAIGDKVTITASSRIQGYAIMAGIVIPCTLLTIVAALILVAGGSETMAACSALAAVAAYYGILYMIRGASAHFFRWDITKLDNNTPPI